ncbi:hypothetical protein SESBI_37387 [Sesbania bispinosa]|nr:hypothetical protein SESBI_37387 [Sesbania bispinosa]
MAFKQSLSLFSVGHGRLQGSVMAQFRQHPRGRRWKEKRVGEIERRQRLPACERMGFQHGGTTVALGVPFPNKELRLRYSGRPGRRSGNG